jgi:hypothetical protein
MPKVQVDQALDRSDVLQSKKRMRDYGEGDSLIKRDRIVIVRNGLPSFFETFMPWERGGTVTKAKWHGLGKNVERRSFRQRIQGI